jgi:hypothetical protein
VKLNRTRALGALAIVALLFGALPAIGSSDALAQACDAPEPLTFEMAYIDETRAGGEPLIVTHPNGNLLWGSHAGTTHFFSPAAPDPTTAAFLQNYEGQTYQYYSEDGGETWEFSPRTPIRGAVDSGLPNSGFSDPEFAIDKAGNVFISEINLANIAFSKSSDGGKTYELMNVIGISMSDRQWMEADEEDVLWFVANTFGGGSPTAGEPVTGSLANRLYKSTDGGATFSAGQSLIGNGQRSSEIQVDKSDGRLYQLDPRGSTLRMSVFADARDQTPPNVDEEQFVVAEDFSRLSSIGPTFDLDGSGNLYAVWDDRGSANREKGIYYTYSTDRGETWSPAQKVNTGDNLAFWPWIAVGDEGGVSITWLENDTATNNNPETVPAGSGWDVMVAQSLTGLGCEESDLAGFTVTKASDEPVHHGTVCNGGTVCQARVVDRRLGDYFSNAVDADGNTVIAVSDTRSGGAVALPLVIRQTGGPTIGDGTEPLRNDVVESPEAEQPGSPGDGSAREDQRNEKAQGKGR